MRATTIRFSDPIYQRLEVASKYTGLPINAIVTAACLDWLRSQFPSTLPAVPGLSALPAEIRESAAAERLLGQSDGQGASGLSSDARAALSRAKAEAERYNHEAIGTEHLLLGIVAEDGSVGALALGQVGIDARRVREGIEFIAGRNRWATTGDPKLSPAAMTAIERAGDLATGRGESEAHTGHLLLALCDEGDGLALRIVESLGTTDEEVRAAVETAMA